MSITSNIRKILIVTAWCVAGAGVMVLLVAAIRARQHKHCRGHEIEIKNKRDELFIDNSDIERLLTNNGTIKLKGRAVQKFDLKLMEEKLERHAWIRDAELYFDNNMVLQVKVRERDPVARVFTTMGQSYYIDSHCIRLSISDKYSAKLPVFTGFPSDKKILSIADSALLAQVKQLGIYIQKDAFWSAQIAQVDITPMRSFELLPTLGNHIVEFGDASDMDKKFRRLFLFYSQVLAKTGMDHYKIIRVQYNGQVVGVKSASVVSRADSLQAQRNVQQLIAAIHQSLEKAADTAQTNAGSEYDH